MGSEMCIRDSDYGVSMFYDYGTKALTPDLIFYIEESLA